MTGRVSGFIRGNAIGLIALFVALGGTTYAATALPNNSVGSSQVINGSLKKADLSGRAISALKGSKGTRGTPGPQGPQGSQGPQGTQGLKGGRGATGLHGPTGATGVEGQQGVQGPAGPSNAYTNYGPTVTIAQGTTVTMSSVTLPPGRYTLSGSIRFSEIDGDAQQTVLSCSFLSFAPVHQQGGYGVTNPTITMPVLGDVTLTFTSTIFLRCTSILKKAGGSGSMIATRVESITPSS